MNSQDPFSVNNDNNNRRRKPKGEIGSNKLGQVGSVKKCTLPKGDVFPQIVTSSVYIAQGRPILPTLFFFNNVTIRIINKRRVGRDTECVVGLIERSYLFVGACCVVLCDKDINQLESCVACACTPGWRLRIYQQNFCRCAEVIFGSPGVACMHAQLSLLPSIVSCWLAWFVPKSFAPSHQWAMGHRHVYKVHTPTTGGRCARTDRSG
jgi:hypothetical protein